MFTLLHKMTDDQVLIAAGLLTRSEPWTDGLYIKWIAYDTELKRRGITWDTAKRAAQKFINRTRYPSAGWQKRYMANDQAQRPAHTTEDSQHAEALSVKSPLDQL